MKGGLHAEAKLSMKVRRAEMPNAIQKTMTAASTSGRMSCPTLPRTNSAASSATITTGGAS
jgi:hypothetical protein